MKPLFLISAFQLFSFSVFAFGGAAGLAANAADANTIRYQANIIATSGTISQRSLGSVNRLIYFCKLPGVWDKIYAMGNVAGTGINAARVKVKYPAGVAAADANNGSFVDGDWVERGASRGLTGNGTSKYTDTGINPVSLSFSTNSAGLWCWTYTAIVGTGSSRGTIGGQSGAAFENAFALGWLNSGSAEIGVIATSNSGEIAAGSATSLTGLLGVNCSGSRSQQFYQNASAIGSPAVATGTLPNFTLPFSAYQITGPSIISFNTRRLGTYAICQGFSLTEIQAFYNAQARFNAEMLEP